MTAPREGGTLSGVGRALAIRVALVGLALTGAACGERDGGDATPLLDAGNDGEAGSSATPGMVTVPAGPFWMGCNDAVDSECKPDEKPYHEVTLSAFEIDRTEVPYSEYQKCVDAGACTHTPCVPSTADEPAVCVFAEGADEYCAWVGKRLPTEAEWEKAARGDDGRKYPWGNQEPDCTLANDAACGEKAMPVDSLPAGASPYGALNMSGNVSELVADCYSADYYANSPSVDPLASGSDCALGARVRRGGNWHASSCPLRVSARCSAGQPEDYFVLGFRCAKSL